MASERTLADEVRQVKRDLRIGRAVRRGGLADRAYLSGRIDLDHVGRHDRLAGAPNERAGHHHGEPEAAECHQAPVARLHARTADALVPGLGGGLVGRDRYGAIPSSAAAGGERT